MNKRGSIFFSKGRGGKRKKKKANVSASVVEIDWIIRSKINKQQTFYYAFYNNVYILSSLFVFL